MFRMPTTIEHYVNKKIAKYVNITLKSPSTFTSHFKIYSTTFVRTHSEKNLKYMSVRSSGFMRHCYSKETIYVTEVAF